MKNEKELLALYREYETILRDQGQDPKTYEDSLDDMESNRLRMCRLFRNYLSHQDDVGYLEVSDSMVKFMEKTVMSLKKVYAKQIMKNGTFVVSNNILCSVAFEHFDKLRPAVIAVKTDTGYDLVSMYDIAKGLDPRQNDEVAAVKHLREKPAFADPMTRIDDLPHDKVIIITDGGTKDGLLRGVIYPEML